MSTTGDRKLLGAYYTPEALVAEVVGAVVDTAFVRRRGGRPLRVLDPACGDGRFLDAVAAAVRRLGGSTELHGVVVDPGAVAVARERLTEASIELGDALRRPWPTAPFDLVVGNPPFLSQLAARTSRGGASPHGGGPYADTAVEFLALGADLVDPDGGRLALVLPQSVLASRDAAPVRDRVDERAEMFWSRWSDERIFDADVRTCVLAFEFSEAVPDRARRPWSEVVTRRRGIPDLPPELAADGALGDRAIANANFRDEYYGLVPAVGDHADGPPLITSGLIDPGRTTWGSQPVTFARRRFERPRVDLARLDARMAEWARRRLVPKVLVANQTRIVEAVCDPDGELLPGVPVVSVYPRGVHWDDGTVVTPEDAVRSAWEIAAVLTSGVASAWLWHRSAGTGLTGATTRVSPAVLVQLPWPAGDLTAATAALRRGDLRGCARTIDGLYGVAEVTEWWERSLDRIQRRGATARSARQALPSR